MANTATSAPSLTSSKAQTSNTTSSDSKIPFSALPLSADGPPGNAWGRYGPNDELGTLNGLTPDAVARAARSEIRTGVRISLDWSLDMPSVPLMGRCKARHEIRALGQSVDEATGQTLDDVVNDDVVFDFNTQSSTQWDGLRHYGYLEQRKYYNDTSPEDIRTGRRLGIDGVAQSGGIVGRGVLLDYAAYAERRGIPVTPFETRLIKLEHLRDLIAECGLEIGRGDVLFVRSGFTAAYEKLSDQERQGLRDRGEPGYAGVEATREVARWLWDLDVAAVAGDAISWEAFPLGHKDPGMRQDEVSSLHQWLLAGWGMPIGEMFDLEKLAQHCREQQRWTFFLSSVPLKLKGGVASPPNAIAIF